MLYFFLTEVERAPTLKMIGRIPITQLSVTDGRETNPVPA